MGRVLQFEDKKALEKAMFVFWEKGYEHTSLKELLAAMSILNGSFYNLFGSKKAIFIKALELYYTDTSSRLDSLLSSSATIQKKIRAIFKYALDRQLRTDCPKGCFIVNSVSADALGDADIRRHVKTYLDAFEHALETAIELAVRNNEFEQAIDPRNSAAVLNFYMQGLMKLCVLDYSDAKLRKQTEYFLSSLGF